MEEIESGTRSWATSDVRPFLEKADEPDEAPKRKSWSEGGSWRLSGNTAIVVGLHVLAKALVYALYLDEYPGLTIEPVIDDRYQPDVVAVDSEGQVLFWVECGAVKPEKIAKILHKYRGARFVFVKKPARIPPFLKIVGKIIGQRKHPVRLEVLGFPEDFERFTDDKGHIGLTHEDFKIYKPEPSR